MMLLLLSPLPNMKAGVTLGAFGMPPSRLDATASRALGYAARILAIE